MSGVLLCSSVCQVFDGPASLLFSCQCWHAGGREAMVMAPPTTHDSAALPCFHGFPPQAIPTTILPHIPLAHLSAVNSSPHPEIALKFLLSSSQLLHLLGDLCPVQDTYGCGNDCLIFFPFSLPQISSFTLSLKCFSSDSDYCTDVEIGPLLQFPYLLKAGPVLLTLLFFPLVPHPTKFCVVLYILFHWSGTPVHSQLVFCMHF